MALILHHLNQSRSQSVLFLLEELGAPYEIRKYYRDPKTMLAPKELRAVHPLGKSPVITDDGVTVAETGLIIDYLIGRHGGNASLRPPDETPDRLRYGYYLHYAEGSLMPLVLMSLVFHRLPSMTPLPLRPVAKLLTKGVTGKFIGPSVSRNLNYLENELAGRAWFAGDTLTGADAIMSFPLMALRARGGLGVRPRLQDWVSRIEARPAWQRAIEKGGPLSFSFG